jgi:hypothetical protein
MCVNRQPALRQSTNKRRWSTKKGRTNVIVRRASVNALTSRGQRHSDSGSRILTVSTALALISGFHSDIRQIKRWHSYCSSMKRYVIIRTYSYVGNKPGLHAKVQSSFVHFKAGYELILRAAMEPTCTFGGQSVVDQTCLHRINRIRTGVPRLSYYSIFRWGIDFYHYGK